MEIAAITGILMVEDYKQDVRTNKRNVTMG
jgi:hypothetical protein